MEYVIYDMDYLDIPLQDMPGPGHLIVCLDPQKRLGEKTWAVGRCISEDGDPPMRAISLFWDKSYAINYAEMYCRIMED